MEGPLKESLLDIFMFVCMDRYKQCICNPHLCVGGFDTLIVNLQDRYKETRYIPEEEQWLPNQLKCFINLAVKYHSNFQTPEEVASFAQRHHSGTIAVDEMTKDSRVTKNIADIFAADPRSQAQKPPRRILIEGAPGIGKTVLLKEIAYRWANGTIMTEAKILFHLYLRDPRFQAVSTIKELIEYFDYLDDEEISVAVKKLRRTNGEGVIFLFDSLDEYSDVLQNRFVSDLLHHKILSKSIIVLTSRPNSSLSFHRKVEKRIEILGFGSAECNEYITKSLEALPKQKELKKYLKRRPLLNCITYIPFYLSVLLFVYNNSGGLPETLTELMEFFIIHTIFLNLRKHGTLVSCVETLADLPKPVNDIVDKLTKLAFYGIQNSKMVFSHREIKQVCPEIEQERNGYGLLQAVQHYPTQGAGTTISYSFLHMTIQEFLAALHISQHSTAKQVELLKQSFSQVSIAPPPMGTSCALMWQMYLGIVEEDGQDSNTWIQFITEHVCGRCYHFHYQFDEKVKEVCTILFKINQISILVFMVFPYHLATLCISKSESPHKQEGFKFTINLDDTGVATFKNFLVTNKDKLASMKNLDMLCYQLPIPIRLCQNNYELPFILRFLSLFHAPYNEIFVLLRGVTCIDHLEVLDEVLDSDITIETILIYLTWDCGNDDCAFALKSKVLYCSIYKSQ